MSHLIFEADVEKKLKPKKTTLMSERKKKKKTSAKLYSLS